MAVIHLLCKQVASCSEEKLLRARSDIKGLFGKMLQSHSRELEWFGLQGCQTQIHSGAKM